MGHTTRHIYSNPRGGWVAWHEDGNGDVVGFEAADGNVTHITGLPPNRDANNEPAPPSVIAGDGDVVSIETTMVKLVDSIISGMKVREQCREQDNAVARLFYHEDLCRFGETPRSFQLLDTCPHIGFSAARYVARHPGATVCCVEPHPQNHAVLSENLASAVPVWGAVRCLAGAVTYAPVSPVCHGTVYEGTPDTDASFVGAPEDHLEWSDPGLYRDQIPVRRVTIADVMKAMVWDHIDTVKVKDMELLLAMPIAKIGRIIAIVDQRQPEARGRVLDAELRQKFGSDSWEFTSYPVDMVPNVQSIFHLERKGWWNT